jgi:hypothetical protein
MKIEAPEDMEAVIARYMEGPTLLRSTLAEVEDADLDRTPDEGGWTIREIVHHVADGDDLWKTCIKMALGNEKAVFSLEWYLALSQIEWSRHWHYSDRSLETSLTFLEATRNHVRQLLDQVPDCWTKSVSYRNPDGTTENVPVGFVVKMQADHLEHHLKRIQAISC